MLVLVYEGGQSSGQNAVSLSGLLFVLLRHFQCIEVVSQAVKRLSSLSRLFGANGLDVVILVWGCGLFVKDFFGLITPI